MFILSVTGTCTFPTIPLMPIVGWAETLPQPCLDYRRIFFTKVNGGAVHEHVACQWVYELDSYVSVAF